MSRAKANFMVHEYQVIHEISKILVQGGDFQSDLNAVLQILHREMGMERGMVSILFHEEQKLHVDICLGMDKRQKEVKYLLGEGITGRVVAEGRPIAVLNIGEEPMFLDKTGLRAGLDPARISFICVPVHYQGGVVGALGVDQARQSGRDNLDREVVFLEEVAYMIASRVGSRRLELENIRLKSSRDIKFSDNVVGNSSVMKELSRTISKVADSSTTVLLSGETGTGKERIAREIHLRSPRRNQALIKINCGAIPENLIESELFGHEKGAFTGAVQQRAGKFEQARGGTIFLDEISEMPANCQVKLLRVLQEREFERVGGNETIKINVRIIAASNKSLDKEVQFGNFRADLFYRLNVFPIHIPPLRERGADIMLLADYFVQRFSDELSKKIKRIDTPAIDMMMAYHWPGNVRELENTIERAVLLSEDGVIHGHHLPPSLQMKGQGSDQAGAFGRFETLVQNYERQLIIESLKESWGNQSEAAKLLGTTKRVIQYKIHKLDIDYKRYGKVSGTQQFYGPPVEAEPH